MYCIYCGKEIDDDSKFCPHCGKFVGKNEPGGAPYSYGGNAYRAPVDDANIGWGVLCFFLPLVGLILYLVWKDEYPNRARMCGKGALIGVITSLATGIIFGIGTLLITFIIVASYGNALNACAAEVMLVICSLA